MSMKHHCRYTKDMPESRHSVIRWWHLLRYHHTSQLAMRLVRTAHNRMGRMLWRHCTAHGLPDVPSLRMNSGPAILAERELTARARREDVCKNAKRVDEGRYRFLGREIALPDPLDWRVEDAAANQLWRFHLHYHDYLLDLAARTIAEDEPRWTDRAWSLVLDWIDGNRLEDRRVLNDAWHPYCISRRLPVWVGLFSVAPPPEPIRERILTSMIWQARYLERHLEWDLRGNHLLENLRALAITGSFFEGRDADRWLSIANREFPKQLAEQILPHGEHFERAPGYHTEMLAAVLDVRDATQAILPDLARCCEKAATTMAAFLCVILHPDGDIPLLGDSCLVGRERLEQLLERAEPHDIRKRSEACKGQRLGDYWLWRQKGDFLLFDAGAVGADALPAHAHADLLTIEASVGGRRLLVDSGVFSYDDEPMRQYCRSTAAHNVLQIDGEDQCDMWSRFRMGYRGQPSRFNSGQIKDFAWASAAHNAYRRHGVPHVGRWIACRPGGPWLCVDSADGAGCHRLTSRLHFHPGVEVRPCADNTLQVELAGQRLQLHWLSPGDVTVEKAWYCPQLGCRQESFVVRWDATSPLPAVCGWCLSLDGHATSVSLVTSPAGGARLCWIENGRRIELCVS